jgi:hypothetical protein
VRAGGSAKPASIRGAVSVHARLVSRGLFLAILVLTWFPSRAESLAPSVLMMSTADLTPVTDAGVQQNMPSGNFGSFPDMPVGYSLDHGALEGYLRFDLSSLPGDARIDSAKLQLYASEGGGSGNFDVRTITSSWEEYTVNWRNRPSRSKNAEDSRGVKTVGWVSWDVTALVQGWWQGTIDNNGLALTGPSGGENWRTFNTRENGSNRPVLSIVYTTPPPPAPTETSIPTFTSAPTDIPAPTDTLTPVPGATDTLPPPTITETAAPTDVHTPASVSTDTPPPPVIIVEPTSAFTDLWVFRGGVYDGWSAHWLDGMAVELYWQGPATSLWTLVASGSTDLSGQFELTAELQPGSHFQIHLGPGLSPALLPSFAISGSGGVPLDAETIQFTGPLPGEYDGNNFHLWRVGVSMAGPDEDDDGLPNDVENAICTDPQNPDSDSDVLLDGWELLGQSFSDGMVLDLPGMGAHPCRPDVFVEIDWTASTPPFPEAMQTLSNVFYDHGIALHIDTGQWGGGEQVPDYSTCSGGAEGHEPPPGFPTLLSTKVDHFDPHRLWTFHYGVLREPGLYPNGDFIRSYACGGSNMLLAVTNSVNSQVLEFGHELGHGLGLGHGGGVGSRVQGRYGDMIYYYGVSAASGGNRKPNYHSAMNYTYNGKAFWNPSTDSRVFLFNYSEVAMPNLDEQHLDERPDSPFALALQGLPRPPGLLPLVRYSCLDPIDPNLGWEVHNADLQTVARASFDFSSSAWGPWQHPGASLHTPGIDWNCDGVIDSDVATNITGDGGDYLLPEPSNPAWSNLQPSLVGADDWSLLPRRTTCPSGISGGDFPPEYLAAADNPPCVDVEELQGGGMDSDESPTSAHEPFDPEEFPPGEFCDGLDNDDNGLVDEGCPDSDQDGIVDPLDNCALVSNADQADRNRDYIGDACQRPPAAPGGLSATREGQAVQLIWSASPEPNVVGYNLYRQLEGETKFRFLGSDWPSGVDTTFMDADRAADASASYVVAAVNRYGYESSWTASVTVSAAQPTAEILTEAKPGEAADLQLDALILFCAGLSVLGLLGMGAIVLIGWLRGRIS